MSFWCWKNFPVMDKFVIVGGFLCFAADVFAIASLATPEWVVTEFAGSVRLGLTVMCQKSDGQPEVCVTPELPQEWLATLLFMILGVIALTLTCIMLVMAPWKPSIVDAAKWIIFSGMVVFCLAALTFPMGFQMPEIGGQPYKLPHGTHVGPSFFLYIFCIVFTIASELCIFKVCPLLLRWSRLALGWIANWNFLLWK